MELLNIREHSGDYKSHRDIETAIAWSTVKKFLTEKNLNAIFDEKYFDRGSLTNRKNRTFPL